MLREIFIESILDPVQKELNLDIWEDDDTLKPKVKSQILDTIQDWLIKYDIDEVKSIYFLGSNTGYQYSETSDIDIEVVLDNEVLQLDEDTLNALWQNLPNGELLKGTEHPINYYLVTYEKDLSKSGTVYNILQEEWVNTPEHDKNNIPLEYVIELAKTFIISIDNRISDYEAGLKEFDLYKKYLKSGDYDEEEIENKIEMVNESIMANLDGLKIIYDMIHTYRQEAFDGMGTHGTIGDKSINNMVYKVLEKFGYLEKLIKFKKIRKDFANQNQLIIKFR